MSQNKNFSEVKVGDILFREGARYGPIRRVKVERVTKTLIILVGGGAERFRVSDGYATGWIGTWDIPPRLHHADDPHILSKVHEQKHRQHADAVRQLVAAFEASATVDNLYAIRRGLIEWDTHVFPTSRK